MQAGPPEGARLAAFSMAVRESTLKRARAVPDGFENWRIDDEGMSFADQVRHLIDADRWLFRLGKGRRGGGWGGGGWGGERPGQTAPTRPTPAERGPPCWGGGARQRRARRAGNIGIRPP